jgi:hypothetical protein
MSAFPGSLGGRAREGSPDWLDGISRQLDRIVDASAGEAKSLADGLRRAFAGERLESAYAALRARLRRSGSATTLPGVDLADLELRAHARVYGLEKTIEEWPRHAVRPPSIRM